MATEKWYLFTFADGFKTVVRGMSKQERAAEERRHGKLIKKELHSTWTK